MYCSGLNPNIEMLYNPVSYPVASGTPPLHTLCSWNHEEVWATIDLTILVSILYILQRYKNIFYNFINKKNISDSSSEL